MSEQTKADRVIIFDTTLRDGEQSPGISLDVGEKLEIAEQLARLGVDYIEAGFPIASQGDFEAVHAIASSIEGPTICGLSRTAHKDIDRCWEAIEPAAKRRIHTFIATSPTHMEHKLKMSPEQVLAEAISAVGRAREYTDDVEFSPEDASRSDFEFMCDVLQAAVDAGAETLNIPDTVGFATPSEWSERIRAIRERITGDYVISTHCHNDLGLAVANSLAAVEAGARQVECTINGIGERAGNAAMEEIVMALKTRSDRMPYTTGIDTQNITKASKLVSTITGFAVQPNKAIVGANAFAHEAGIHQDGMLKHAGTYEIMTPESVGLIESKLIMGKHSGRHAFIKKIEELGYEIGDNALEEAFSRFKALADKKKDVFDEDIAAILDDEAGQGEEHIKFISLQVVAGSIGPQKADLVLEIDDQEVSETATGNGPVDATFNAIGALFPHESVLQLYQVHAVTGGTDAQAEVTVRLEENGRTVNGLGADTDTLVASARAYINALNKLRVKREKSAPAALSA